MPEPDHEMAGEFYQRALADLPPATMSLDQNEEMCLEG
jgi:hypothetical protein